MFSQSVDDFFKAEMLFIDLISKKIFIMTIIVGKLKVNSNLKIVEGWHFKVNV